MSKFVDFVNFFKGYTNNLSRFAKLEWTQLQFIFEWKNGDIETSYRAYASDEVIEIFSKANFAAINGSSRTQELMKNKKYDMVPMATKVNTYKLPQKTVLSRTTDGKITLPYGTIPPASFVKEIIDPKAKEINPDTKKK